MSGDYKTSCSPFFPIINEDDNFSQGKSRDSKERPLETNLLKRTKTPTPTSTTKSKRQRFPRDISKVCFDCGALNTPLWRHINGEIVCNACGLYYKYNKSRRKSFITSFHHHSHSHNHHHHNNHHYNQEQQQHHHLDKDNETFDKQSLLLNYQICNINDNCESVNNTDKNSNCDDHNDKGDSCFPTMPESSKGRRKFNFKIELIDNHRFIPAAALLTPKSPGGGYFPEYSPSIYSPGFYSSSSFVNTPYQEYFPVIGQVTPNHNYETCGFSSWPFHPHISPNPNINISQRFPFSTSSSFTETSSCITLSSASSNCTSNPNISATASTSDEPSRLTVHADSPPEVMKEWIDRHSTLKNLLLRKSD